MSKIRFTVSLAAIFGCFALAVQLALSSCSLQTPRPDELSAKELRIQLDDESVMEVRAYRTSDEGVRAPRLLRKVEPDYTDQAKDAKTEGQVVLAVEVGPDGKAHNIRVIRSLDQGLDNNAIEAVRQWEFEPAVKDGEAVTVRANVEVNYRLN